MDLTPELEALIKELNENPEMDSAWEDYRSENPNTVAGYMEELPTWVERWKSENTMEVIEEKSIEQCIIEEKPDARHVRTVIGDGKQVKTTAYYYTKLEDGRTINFTIPSEEATDVNLKIRVPAELLIRWIDTGDERDK